MHSHLGVLGVTGFLMQDVKANPLDYVEGGPLNERRRFPFPYIEVEVQNLNWSRAFTVSCDVWPRVN